MSSNNIMHDNREVERGMKYKGPRYCVKEYCCPGDGARFNDITVFRSDNNVIILELGFGPDRAAPEWEVRCKGGTDPAEIEWANCLLQLNPSVDQAIAAAISYFSMK